MLERIVGHDGVDEGGRRADPEAGVGGARRVGRGERLEERVGGLINNTLLGALRIASMSFAYGACFVYAPIGDRAVAGLAPFRPPDLPAPPPTADRRGPAAAPDPKRPRVDPEPAPEEEESQEISIVGVRTAEERDAEAFANAIVIDAEM